jgi:hypothetical protein
MKKNKENITRKEAIKKMGRYAGLTALGTFMILSPKKAQAQSAPPDPGFFN